MAAVAKAPVLFAQRGRGQGAPAAGVPPSIAALTSMRGQARPITSDERRGRIERARQLMAQEKIDALILSAARRSSTSRTSGGAAASGCSRASSP